MKKNDDFCTATRDFNRQPRKNAQTTKYYKKS